MLYIYEAIGNGSGGSAYTLESAEEKIDDLVGSKGVQFFLVIDPSGTIHKYDKDGQYVGAHTFK